MKTKNPIFYTRILKKIKMKNLLLLPLFLFALSCTNDLDSESPLEEIQNGEFIYNNPGVWKIDYENEGVDSDGVGGNDGDITKIEILGKMIIGDNNISWDMTTNRYRNGNKYYSYRETDSETFNSLNDKVLIYSEIEVVTNTAKELKIKITDSGDSQIFTFERRGETIIFSITDYNGDYGESILTKE